MNNITIKLPGQNGSVEITNDSVAIGGATLPKANIQSVQIGKPLPMFAILKDQCDFWIHINPDSESGIGFSIPPSNIGSAATKAFNEVLSHFEGSIFPQIKESAQSAFSRGETISFISQVDDGQPPASIALNKNGVTLPAVGPGGERTGETRTIPWADANMKSVPFFFPGLLTFTSSKDGSLRCSFDWRQVPNGWMLEDFFKWASQHPVK